ncbi:RrF2 family transcriptional regulator [Nocardia brasiliensis]|uniref:RrF2 family transcriptional regulator n=1 Tax=Nocardia brasiliensis TaxID=37326 RepID=UPI001893FB79|nr:Rrf2 family transcriptional regulator [Nocardia brasiliensis]MBF6129891.1 Rrf2 family transcriptional regulator [Nocardia brasiliensis]
MQLARSTDLALRTMMRLAVSGSADQRVTAKLVARQVDSSEHQVAKAVSRLVELGFVASYRGRRGGIFLTEAGRAGTVGQLIRALEGDAEVVECLGEHPCPLATNCRLRRVLQNAKEAFYRELDNYHLTDLVSPRIVELLHLPAIAPPAHEN